MFFQGFMQTFLLYSMFCSILAKLYLVMIYRLLSIFSICIDFKNAGIKNRLKVGVLELQL